MTGIPANVDYINLFKAQWLLHVPSCIFQKFYILLAECIPVLCMHLRTAVISLCSSSLFFFLYWKGHVYCAVEARFIYSSG